MVRTILIFGLIAGFAVAVPMCLMVGLSSDHGSMSTSLVTGYLVMLAALSMVFVGIKRYRDRELGGVIKFLPALGVGLGISVVAGLIYALGWEITLAATNYGFAESYANAMIESAREKGASPAELDEISAQMSAFQEQYANPLFRLPMTFIEIFPVGVLVSLVSAALLRNPRFMPSRAPAA